MSPCSILRNVPFLMFVRCKQGAPFSGIQVELFAIKVFCWFGSSLVRVTIPHFGDEVPKNPGGLQIMATYGKIDAYEDDEDWCQYVERLEAYFEANDIDASEKQRAILLSVCGGKMYKLIRDLVAPALPKETTYKEITDLVKATRTQCLQPSYSNLDFTRACVRQENLWQLL